jgi:histone deacetylase 6
LWLRYGAGFFPGTGAPHDVGFGKGAGFSVNVAFRSAGYSDAEYASAFEHVVMPVARQFAPELVLVSAAGSPRFPPVCPYHL